MAETATAPKLRREVPEEFITTLQNNQYVLFDGLLALAHEDNVKEMDAWIIERPDEINGDSWVVKAKVVTDRGTFYGIGDANPQNVNRNIARHIIRMAETRATARALRKAVNVGMTSVEELGDNPDAPPPRQRSQGSQGQQRQGQRSQGGGQRQQSGGVQRGGARNAQRRDSNLITKSDAARLRHMLGELGANVQAFEAQKGKIEEMSKAHGEEWLKSVSKRLEEAQEGTQEPEEEMAPESGTEDVELTEEDFEDIPF